MSHQLDRVRRTIRPSTAGLDLYAWQNEEPVERTATAGGVGDLSDWRVIDDWPRPIPVTAEEIDVFEAWFGDILNELFGPA